MRSRRCSISRKRRSWAMPGARGGGRGLAEGQIGADAERDTPARGGSARAEVAPAGGRGAGRGLRAAAARAGADAAQADALAARRRRRARERAAARRPVTACGHCPALARRGSWPRRCWPGRAWPPICARRDLYRQPLRRLPRRGRPARCCPRRRTSPRPTALLKPDLALLARDAQRPRRDAGLRRACCATREILDIVAHLRTLRNESCRSAAVRRCCGLLAVAAVRPAAAQRVKDVFEVGPQRLRARARRSSPRAARCGSAPRPACTRSTWPAASCATPSRARTAWPTSTCSRSALDREGYKWFGTNAGGVSRYKDGKWKTFFPMHGLADYWIYSFAQQKQRRLLDRHLGRRQHGRLQDAASSAPTSRSWSTSGSTASPSTRTDRVWFGTEGGVSMFDGKRWTSLDAQGRPGRAPTTTSCRSRTNTGLGTRSRHDLSVGAEGPATYNPNYVFSILAARRRQRLGRHLGRRRRALGRQGAGPTSRRGTAWPATSSTASRRTPAACSGSAPTSGVSRWDGKAFRNLGIAEGLLDAHVYALAVAPDGDLWVGTKKGVARIAVR
ncbi:MAG: hypothetical protein MZV63_26905 [Marinilabiliales bacterium]|nr:hypothetical protein [Marinilabiliales bacterium]